MELNSIVNTIKECCFLEVSRKAVTGRAEFAWTAMNVFLEESLGTFCWIEEFFVMSYLNSEVFLDPERPERIVKRR